MATPSRIRKLCDVAKHAPTPNAALADFSSLFDNALHESERNLFGKIMASVESKDVLKTDLERLDASLAVASGLILARLLDAGDFDEAEKIAPTWTRHGKPLIAEIRAQLSPRKTTKKGASVLDVLMAAADRLPEQPMPTPAPTAEPMKGEDRGLF